MEAGIEGHFAFVAREVGDLVSDLVPGAAKENISMYFPSTLRSRAPNYGSKISAP